MLRAVSVVCALMMACNKPKSRPEESKHEDGVVVEGVVRLSPSANLPSYVSSDFSDKGGVTFAPACGSLKVEDRYPVTMTKARALRGVLVAASGFKATFAEPRTEHVLSIRNCRLTPRMLTATRNDTLRIINESSVALVPAVGRTRFGQALYRGASRVIPLPLTGVFPVGCTFGYPCGRSEVAVFFHPLHTQTDSVGRFRLKGVPKEARIEIHAWHPLFKDAAVVVSTADGRTKPVQLLLEPLARAPAESSLDKDSRQSH